MSLRLRDVRESSGDGSYGSNNKRNQFLMKMDFLQVSSRGLNSLPPPLCFV